MEDALKHGFCTGSTVQAGHLLPPRGQVIGSFAGSASFNSSRLILGHADPSAVPRPALVRWTKLALVLM